MKLIWRLKGEDYHSLKAQFKSSRESLGFKYVSKWNDPFSRWETSNAVLEGTYVRMEVDGKEKTISATLTLTGEDIDFLTECRKQWDLIFPVKGEEPKIQKPKTKGELAPEVQWQFNVFEIFASDSIDWWNRGHPWEIEGDQTVIRMQNLERKRLGDKWFSFLIELKEKFPFIDVSKFQPPDFLKESQVRTHFGHKEGKVVVI